MPPVSPSLCKNILVFIYAKARILITICLLNACTILKKVYRWRTPKTVVYVLLSLKDTRVSLRPRST